MPIVKLYPVGEVLPTPLPNAQLSVPAAGDINLFGGNQAQDLQVAGQRLGQASDNVFAIYERMAKEANDTRVQDFNNQYIAGEREILRSGPDAYYKQNGADAIDGAAATAERLTKLKERVLGQAANEYQRQRLRPILDAHRAVSADGIVRYAGEQQAVYERTVASTAIETSKAEAVANPANLANAVARAEGATRALFKGQVSEVIENEGRKVGGSIVSAVIGDHLARNDPRGVTLFRQHRDRLDPRDRRVLGAAAETLSNTVAAADWLRDRSATLAATLAPTGDAALDAVNVASPATAEPPPVTSWGGRLLDREGVAGHRQRLAGIEDRRRALTALNEQEFAGDPVRRRANQTAIDTDTARTRAAAKTDADDTYAALERHMKTGGPGGGPAITLPPPTIMSRLTPEQQDAVAARVNRSIEGKATRTDQPTWYVIHQGLTGDDADERARWADTNLAQFRDQLSDEDFAALSKLQATMRANDGGAEASRQQVITRLVNRALRAAGIDPTPPPDGDATQPAPFRRALDDELSTFEAGNGRPATAGEAFDVVTQLSSRALEGGWFTADHQEVTSPADEAAPAADLILEEAMGESFGAEVGGAPSADTSSVLVHEGSERSTDARFVQVSGGGKKKGKPPRLPGPGKRPPSPRDEKPSPQKNNPNPMPGGPPTLHPPKPPERDKTQLSDATVAETAARTNIPEAKIREITATPKPNRPDPRTYMSEEAIEKHLKPFRETGVVRIFPRANFTAFGTLGPGDGGFVLPRSHFDDLVRESKGDLKVIETRLQLTPGSLTSQKAMIVYIEVPDLSNLRIPSGNERGAIDGLWAPGGFTGAGVPEAIVDLPATVPYTEIQLKPGEAR